MKRWIPWMLGVAAAAGASAQGSPVKPEPLSQARGGFSLPKVLKQGLTGLALESDGAQDRARAEARDVISLLHGRGAAADARSAAVDGCAHAASYSPYCPVILKHLKARTRRVSIQAKSSKNELRKRLRVALLNGQLPGLSGASEFELLQALKEIGDFDKLRPLLSKVVAPGSCPATSLLTALGLKVEEYFPDEGYRTLAVSLYRRSLECGSDLSAMKAGYRLGLLYVWQENCASAEAVLSRVSGHPEGIDFRSRSLYWRLHCARKSANKKLEEQLSAELLRTQPMSLHGLIAGGAQSTFPRGLVNDQEPSVQFRSLKKPELNRPIRGAEALLNLGRTDLAQDQLEAVIPGLQDAEAEFQLYVAVLLKRSGDVLRKFQVLSSLFKENNDLISQHSLEMLYPQSGIELIRTYRSVVDPYLVLSLIRQESAFNERAMSRAGAMGLMQLMPRTASRIEPRARRRLFDPTTNVRIGVKYFSKLLGKYNGDTELALAAYNAGSERVDVWTKRYPVANRLLFVDLIPFRETREYVASIARNYFWYVSLYTRAEHEMRAPTGATQAPAFIKPASVFSLFRS
jgi:soluble lytic murein transglycosylase